MGNKFPKGRDCASPSQHRVPNTDGSLVLNEYTLLNEGNCHSLGIWLALSCIYAFLQLFPNLENLHFSLKSRLSHHCPCALSLTSQTKLIACLLLWCYSHAPSILWFYICLSHSQTIYSSLMVWDIVLFISLFQKLVKVPGIEPAYWRALGYSSLSYILITS